MEKLFRRLKRTETGRCELCGKESEKISNFLPICLNCLHCERKTKAEQKGK